MAINSVQLNIIQLNKTQKKTFLSNTGLNIFVPPLISIIAGYAGSSDDFFPPESTDIVVYGALILPFAIFMIS